MRSTILDILMLVKVTVQAFRKAMVPPEMNRRQGFMRRLQYAQMIYDDSIPDDKPDSWWGLSEWWDDKVRQQLCDRLNGHVPDNDHCGKPAHRYCINCNKLMPNAEVPKMTWRW